MFFVASAGKASYDGDATYLYMSPMINVIGHPQGWLFLFEIKKEPPEDGSSVGQ
jgi:hypothetical protein